MKNVLPFKAPEPFARHGIDWTKDATTERERSLREAYLTYETSCGQHGLASLMLLAIVSRRQGAIACDLKDAADFAEIMLAMQLRKHQEDTLTFVHTYLAECGKVWQ